MGLAKVVFTKCNPNFPVGNPGSVPEFPDDSRNINLKLSRYLYSSLETFKLFHPFMKYELKFSSGELC